VSRTTINAGTRAYTASFDEDRRRGDLYQSIVIAQLVDELTEQPVQGGVLVTTDLRSARVKAAGSGISGVAGVPSRLFPDLDAQPYAFDVRFEVDGFVPLVRPDVAVPQQPGFPGGFGNVDLGRLALRRLPVAIVVRATQLDSQNHVVALPGATVEVTAIWRRMQDLAGAPSGPEIVALRPALYAARPQPGTTLEPVTMTPLAEPDRALRRAAEPGSRDLEVSRVGALAPGSVVGIDRSDPDRAEYIQVEDVVGPSDPESPATLVLAFPVRRSHRENGTVREVTPTGLGPPTADLVDEGLPGDVTVFVSSVAPFGGAPIIRITGGLAPDEYVGAATYGVVTDGAGYGGLPPLSRVAAVQIAASAPGPLTAPPTSFTPHYGLYENHLYLVLE